MNTRTGHAILIEAEIMPNAKEEYVRYFINIFIYKLTDFGNSGHVLFSYLPDYPV